MHIDDVCETFQCETKECNLRHPKICSFYRDYGFCKFAEYCSFSHNVHKTNDALENEIRDIKKELVSLKENEKDHNKQIQKLEDEINDKEKVIRNIFIKFEECNARMEILEKKVKVAEDDKAMIETKFLALEKRIQTPSESLSCEICDSIFKTESMLNEHMTEIHTENFSCDLCDLIFNNKCKLIEHTDEMHSSKKVNNENEAAPTKEKSDKNTSNFNKSDDKVFQCNDCNYKSSSENGIKIHRSKKHVAVLYNPYDSPTRGLFPPRYPPRFPNRFPNSPMW